MVSIILGMGVGPCLVSHAQMGGGVGGGISTVPGTEFGGATDPSSIQIQDGLRIIPSLQVSERYDSNVFFLPRSQLQRLNPEDVVTTVVPQLRGLYTDHENRVKLNVIAGAVGSYYTNNTGLSYVGANAGMVLDMSGLLSQWRPGTRWTVSDTYFKTPQPPAFLVGDQSGAQANPLIAGYQTTRANTSSNSVNTLFELPLSMTVKLSGSYTHSFIDYGASQAPQASPLISQEAHAYTAGLIAQVSLKDTIRVDFTGSQFDQGGQGAFTTRGGALGWAHNFSHAISLNTAVGAQVLSGEQLGARLPTAAAPFGSLAILWNNPTTFFSLSYRSGITPSLQFQGAPMLSHTVSFNVSQNTPIRDLVALIGANYSVANDYGSNSGRDLSWTTVGATAGLRYRVTQKTFLTLTYSYLNVDNVFGGRHFAYERHVAQLGLAQAFY